MTDRVDFIVNYPIGAGTGLDGDFIRTLLGQSTSWDERYRQLLQLTRKVPALPLEWRQTELEVSGCESRVWLLPYRDNNGIYHFVADSESRIVKSLLITLLAVANHQPADKIQQIQVASYFAELGLAQHITPSRTNGLQAVWKKMSDFCALSA
ncbi:SufE family protein [Tolumonas lignilytica]|uniref:SufE family protein n=1 Tax=Tolumonas lignilytica TaxID=1283284 RepID=UPI000465A4AF|nr:SufE family protein [Tolumonas lignilytica]